MMAAVALICMTISLVFFSACHSEKTTSTENVVFSLDGDITAPYGDETEQVAALGAFDSYSKKVDELVKASKGADISDQIISECNAIYKSHSKYTHFKGNVIIYKKVGDKAETVLKEYVYPYSE